MTRTAPTPAMHFDDFAQQHLAAGLGMWIFLATEVLFFGGLFLGYTIYRHAYAPEFGIASHHLYLSIGAGNTAVLLTSSFCMAMAVHAAAGANRWATVAWLAATIALGVLFLGLKGMEYYLDYREHVVPALNFYIEGLEGPAAHRAQMFFVIYFLMTGLHAIHVTVGVVVISFLLFMTTAGRYLGEASDPVEMVGLYWHFVDIIWIFLLPLLYMVPYR